MLSPLVRNVDGAFGSPVDLYCKGCSSEAQTSVSMQNASPAKAVPPKPGLVSAGKIHHLRSAACQGKLFKGNVVLCLST